jgi:hypothetical protein
MTPLSPVEVRKGGNPNDDLTSRTLLRIAGGVA